MFIIPIYECYLFFVWWYLAPLWSERKGGMGVGGSRCGDVTLLSVHIDTRSMVFRQYMNDTLRLFQSQLIETFEI